MIKSRFKAFDSRLFLVIIVLSVTACTAFKENRLEYAELTPIFKQNNLDASASPENRKEIEEVEEVDSELYEPLAGKTIFLQSSSPTFDSEGLKPRYWLRIEDYQSPQLATKRASEYLTVGTYDRLERAWANKHGDSAEKDSHMLSKTTVRLWAVARGKRVYALTTDANLFTLTKIASDLQKAITELPEI